VTAGLCVESAKQVKQLVSDDPVLVDLIDRAVQQPVGSNLPVSNSNTRPTGTTTAQAHRRLRAQAPDLHAQVLGGDLSALDQTTDTTRRRSYSRVMTLPPPGQGAS
jgi:hypothetical protein